MSKVCVLNEKFEKASELDLPADYAQINPHNLYLYVKSYLSGMRSNSAHTKTRAFVSGGGKKPWRQKGTGRARVGSIRSPLWVGGGTVFGPTPRSHAKGMTKKARRLAVKSALSEKLRANELIVIDQINFEAPKTKQVVEMMKAFEASKALIIDGGKAVENTVLSARNIPGVKAIGTCGINIYDLVHYTKLFITQEAVKQIEEVLA